MKVDQAIVSSIASKSRTENEIVNHSGNIDIGAAAALCRWSPSRCQLAFAHSESFNFFPIDENRVALARSVYGERENRRYGSRRVNSHVVVLERRQLRGYQDNIVLLARVLNSMGLLTLRTMLPRQLPQLEIPEHTLLVPTEFERPDLAQKTQQILRGIEIHHQVVLLGLEDPLPFLCALLADIPRELRLQFSFATGLKVIDARPFHLQFFQEANFALEKELASRQLRTISLRPVQAAPF